MIKHRYIFAAYSIIYGFICWVPGIVLHFIARKSFFGKEALAITIIMPVLALFLSHYGKRHLPNNYVKLSPLLILFGIWLLGPTATGIGAMASGGGFSDIENLKMLPLLTLVFPGATWMMSTYDGSLGGIIITTISLTVSFIRNRIKYRKEKDIEDNEQPVN